MNFVMNRDFTLKTTLGHSIRFVANEPVHVPPECRAEARRWGAVPAEGEVDTNEDVIPEKPVYEHRQEPQHEERENILLEAIGFLVDKNDPKDFGANGAPRPTAIKDIVHFEIDTAERNQMWALYTQRQHAAANPSNTTEEAPPEE